MSTAITGLENRYTGNCIVGSNPTPSASFMHKNDPQTMNLGVFSLSGNKQMCTKLFD